MQCHSSVDVTSWTNIYAIPVNICYLPTQADLSSLRANPELHFVHVNLPSEFVHSLQWGNVTSEHSVNSQETGLRRAAISGKNLSQAHPFCHMNGRLTASEMDILKVDPRIGVITRVRYCLRQSGHVVVCKQNSARTITTLSVMTTQYIKVDVQPISNSCRQSKVLTLAHRCLKYDYWN